MVTKFCFTLPMEIFSRPGLAPNLLWQLMLTSTLVLAQRWWNFLRMLGCWASVTAVGAYASSTWHLSPNPGACSIPTA